MKDEIIPHLEGIASIMNMTKINEVFYYGENRTLFKGTNYGFVLAGLKDLDNPKHPNYISKSYSLLLPR